MDVKGRNFTRFLERREAYNSQHDSKTEDKQHSKGKLSAWERIHILFDEDTFEEIDAYVTADKTNTMGMVVPSPNKICSTASWLFGTRRATTPANS